MDTRAAQRARRKAIKADLAEAYTDDEACPPEWLDLLNQVREASAHLRAQIDEEVERFVSEHDIRSALRRRERVSAGIRARIEEVNKLVARLNLIAPHHRFTRSALDAEELLRPLFWSKRPSP